MDESRATILDLVYRFVIASGIIADFADTEDDRGSQDLSMTWQG